MRIGGRPDKQAMGNPAGGNQAKGARAGWIFFSPGLDGDYDLVPSRDFDAAIAQPSAHLLTCGASYDPTNGTVSNGDIYRVRQ